MEDPEDLASLFSQLETTTFDPGQDSFPSQKVHGELEDQGGQLEPMDGGQKDLGWLLSQQTCDDVVVEFLPSTTWDWCHDSYPGQKVHGELKDYLDQNHQNQNLNQNLNQNQNQKGGEGRQFRVNENSDLDLTPTFNLTAAPLWQLLALDLSTAMVVITGATLLRSYNLEKFETVMVARCKKVLGRRGTMSSCKTTEMTRGEMTRDKVGRQTEQTDSMMAHLCHLSSASLATIFLSGTDRLNAQSGIDERTRVNDQLKGSFIEVAV
jgi:hypothetical protein